MKIAILTSGILPVPAVQGGAVENLVDFYLEYNDRHRLHDITVYSVWHRDVEQHPALQSSVNHYKYIKVDSLWGKLKKRFYHLTHKECYYHYHIEYFLHEAIKHIRRTAYDVIIIENPEKCEAMGKAAKKHSLLFSKEHYARNFFEALSLH